MNDTAALSLPSAFQPLFSNKKYKIFRGGRMGAKSESIARYLLCEGMKGDHLILCARETQNSIADSVHALLKSIIEKNRLPYSFTRNKIKCLVTNSEFIFHGIQNHTVESVKSLYGANKCWIEEGQSISLHSLNILIPTIIRNPGYEIIASYNPFEENDPINILWRPDHEDYACIEVNYFDNPYLSKDARKVINEMQENDYNLYLHIYEGAPLLQNDFSVFSIEAIKSAMDRVIEEPSGDIYFGVDIARGGGDRLAIVKTMGLKVIDIWSTKNKLTVHELADKVKMMGGDEAKIIRVDDTAVGGGYTDELQRVFGKHVVQPINFGESGWIDKQIYPDVPSYLYFKFLDMLDKVDLPENRDLRAELTQRRYEIDRYNRRKVESKDNFKKRFGKSPDLTDALLLAFVGKPIKSLNYSFV